MELEFEEEEGRRRSTKEAFFLLGNKGLRSFFDDVRISSVPSSWFDPDDVDRGGEDMFLFFPIDPPPPFQAEGTAPPPSDATGAPSFENNPPFFAGLSHPVDA